MRVVEFRPVQVDEEFDDDPCLFLTGPIQGAPNWQADAIEILTHVRSRGDLRVYNPRSDNLGSHTYKQQVGWEKKHLTRARDYGAILFWFAAQDPSVPYPEGRAYAQTTRIEFGRALGWSDYDQYGLDIVIGFDRNYNGGNESYVRLAAAEHNIPVYCDLEQTCRKAARLALK